MHVLITGKPAIGKTTAVIKVVEQLRALSVSVAGFYTGEIREGKKRVGFGITTISDGKSGIFAHVDIKSPHRVLRYGVDVVGFERLVMPIFERRDVDILVVDEIGGMELFSKNFEREILKALSRKQPKILGVIQEKRTMMVKDLEGVKIYRLDSTNRDRAPNEILVMLGYG